MFLDVTWQLAVLATRQRTLHTPHALEVERDQFAVSVEFHGNISTCVSKTRAAWPDSRRQAIS